MQGRIHSRFSQNYWTNFGGFGGRNPASRILRPPCVGGDCGEFDPRSNQYIKLRGLTARFTPGYKWLDSATIGANDFGKFDPFMIGRIRYIDRDNAARRPLPGLGRSSRQITWDLTRVSLPRLWAGPNFTTGDFTRPDARLRPAAQVGARRRFDVGGIFELRAATSRSTPPDSNLDNGRDLRAALPERRGRREGRHPPGREVGHPRPLLLLVQPIQPEAGAPTGFGLTGFSPVPAGKHDDNGLQGATSTSTTRSASACRSTFEVFNIGAEYVSIMAARRESDVLLTEGHDAAFVFPGPANAGVRRLRRQPHPHRLRRLGRATPQQVATINVDNEFTDFDEPMAETAIGWKGITVVPAGRRGSLDLSGEYTYIDLQHQLAGLGRPQPRHRRHRSTRTRARHRRRPQLPHRLRAVPGQEDAHRGPQGQVRARRRQGASTSSARSSTSRRRTSG